MGPKKLLKNDQKLQQKDVEKVEGPITRRTRLRTKLSIVNSSLSTTGSVTRNSILKFKKKKKKKLIKQMHWNISP